MAIPIPVPDPGPDAGPGPFGIPAPPIPNPPIPHIGNPVPYVVHGAEAAWSDIADHVKSVWHGITDFFGAGINGVLDDVRIMIDVAIQTEQTAWSSFVSILEAWVNDSVRFLEDAITGLDHWTTGIVLDIYDTIVADIDAAIAFVGGAVRGIEADLWSEWWQTVQGIENDIGAVRAWAIDNIYSPLLGEVWRVGVRAELDLQALRDDIAREFDQLRNNDIARLLTRLGVLSLAITALQTWVDECGGPMCEQMGPNTDFSKLLKLLDLAGMLALLTSVGGLTADDLERLAATVVGLGEHPVDAFVNAFFDDGDTLARAIADTLPQLAL